MTARLKIKRTDAQDAFVEERSWRCHTCTRMLDPLDPGEERYCFYCGSYWEDVKNGLFEDEPMIDEMFVEKTP